MNDNWTTNIPWVVLAVSSGKQNTPREKSGTPWRRAYLASSQFHISPIPPHQRSRDGEPIRRLQAVLDAHTVIENQSLLRFMDKNTLMGGAFNMVNLLAYQTIKTLVSQGGVQGRGRAPED